MENKTRTTAGLFQNWEDAEQAVAELNRRGFAPNDISIAAPERLVQSRLTTGGNPAGSRATSGIVGGATVGGLIGLLLGIGALAVPGIGPVIAGGALGTALASTAAGAGIGGTTGGILGALLGLGVPEEEARFYSEGIKRGGILVTVETPGERALEAQEIFQQARALDIGRTRESWKTTGWNDFDETTMPNSNYPTLLGS